MIRRGAGSGFRLTRARGATVSPASGREPGQEHAHLAFGGRKQRPEGLGPARRRDRDGRAHPLPGAAAQGEHPAPPVGRQHRRVVEGLDGRLRRRRDRRSGRPGRRRRPDWPATVPRGCCRRSPAAPRRPARRAGRWRRWPRSTRPDDRGRRGGLPAEPADAADAGRLPGPRRRPPASRIDAGDARGAPSAVHEPDAIASSSVASPGRPGSFPSAWPRRPDRPGSSCRRAPALRRCRAAGGA